MSEKLLSCPFCGADGNDTDYGPMVDDYGPTVQEGVNNSRVICNECGAYGQSNLSRELAIAAWNTRSGPAWQDKPTVPGLWLFDFTDGTVSTATITKIVEGGSLVGVRRCYGPIPSDEAGGEK